MEILSMVVRPRFTGLLLKHVVLCCVLFSPSVDLGSYPHGHYDKDETPLRRRIQLAKLHTAPAFLQGPS